MGTTRRNLLTGLLATVAAPVVGKVMPAKALTIADLQRAREAAKAASVGCYVTMTARGGKLGPFRQVLLYRDGPEGDPSNLVGVYDYGSPVTLEEGEEFVLELPSGQRGNRLEPELYSSPEGDPWDDDDLDDDIDPDLLEEDVDPDVVPLVLGAIAWTPPPPPPRCTYPSCAGTKACGRTGCPL